MEDSDELESLQELHDAVYEQARDWFQNLKVRFHNQILQHFGQMPEREDDIQVDTYICRYCKHRRSIILHSASDIRQSCMLH